MAESDADDGLMLTDTARHSISLVRNRPPAPSSSSSEVVAVLRSWTAASRLLTSCASVLGLPTPAGDLSVPRAIHTSRQRSNEAVVLDWTGAIRLVRLTDATTTRSWPAGYYTDASLTSVAFWADGLLLCTADGSLLRVPPERLALPPIEGTLSEPGASATDVAWVGPGAALDVPASESRVAYVLCPAADTLDLVALVTVTPLQHAIKTLEADPSVEVAALCSDLRLHPDDVLKHLWTTGAKTPARVRDVLARVTDTPWVVAQCLADPPDLDTARHLLMTLVERTSGLDYTAVEREILDAVDGLDGETGGTSSGHAVDQCLARAKALAWLDRLDSYEAVQAAQTLPASLAGYMEFRAADMVATAAELAAAGAVDALDVLLTREAPAVLPFRLDLLDLLPELLAPAAYARLLPVVGADGVETDRRMLPWRKSDWTAAPATRELMQLVLGDDEDDGGLGGSGHGAGVAYPADKHTVEQWYIRRVSRIEAFTGTPTLALALARLGVDKGVAALDGLVHRLVLLDKLAARQALRADDNNNSTSSDVPGECLTLDTLPTVAMADVLWMLLRDSTAAGICDDIRHVVVPLLALPDIRSLDSMADAVDMDSMAGTVGQWHLLCRVLARVAATNAAAVLAVFQASKPDVPVDARVMPSVQLLARTLTDACYHYFDAAALGVYQDMLACLPKTVGGTWAGSVAQPTPPPAAAQWPRDLAHRLQQLRIHLKAVRLMAALSAPASPADMAALHTSAAAQRRFVDRVPRLLFGAARDEGSVVSDDAFWTLVREVFALHTLGLVGSVSTDTVFTAFLGVAMSNGLFSVVKTALHGQPLGDTGPRPCVSLCQSIAIDTARELIDNAETGSKSSGLMRQAVQVLTHVPASAATSAELDLIAGIDTLLGTYRLADDDTGAPVLPVQVRHATDRLVYVQRVLRLVRQLLGDAAAQSAAVKVRLRVYLAHAAMETGDWDVAAHYCTELMRLAFDDDSSSHTHSSSSSSGDGSDGAEMWAVFMRLVESTHMTDVRTKRDLVSHALRVCPDDRVRALVALWRHVEMEAVAARWATARGVSGLVDTRTQVSAVMDGLAERVQRDVGRTTGTAMCVPDFYAQPGSGHHSSFYDLAEPPATGLPTHAAADLLRCQEVLGGGDGPRDATSLLFDYAVTVIGDDVVAAMAALAATRDKTLYKTYFETRVAEVSGTGTGTGAQASDLAMRFFATAALLETGTAINSCGDVLEMATAAVRDMAAAGTRIDKASAYLEAAVAYRAMGRASAAASVTSGLVARLPHLDVARFESDAAYRTSSLVDMACTLEHDSVDAALRFADAVGVQRQDVWVGHLRWALTDPSVSGRQAQQHLQRYASLAVEHAGATLAMLVDVYANVGEMRLDKVHAYYRVLGTVLDTLGTHSESAAVVSARVALIETVIAMPALAGLSLTDLLAAARDDRSGLLRLWQASPSADRLHSLIDIAPTLHALVDAVPVLGDRPCTVEPGYRHAVSAVNAAHFARVLDDAQAVWANVDTATRAHVVNDVIAAVNSGRLVDPDTLPIVSRLVVGPLARALPLATRTAVLDAVDGRVGVDARGDVEAMRRHLLLMDGLARIDVEFDDAGGLPSAFIAEMDAACGDHHMVTLALLALIRNAVNPAIVVRTAALATRVVAAGSAGDTDWTFGTLATRAVSDALADVRGYVSPDDETVARIEVVAGTVLEYLDTVGSSGAAGVNADEQTDTSGWDLDADFLDGIPDDTPDDDVAVPAAAGDAIDASDAKTHLRRLLSQCIEDGSPFAVSVRMAALRLLHRHFADSDGDGAGGAVSLVGARLTAMIQGVWDIQVNTADVTETDKWEPLFDRLLSISSTRDHAVRVLQLLLEWFPPAAEPQPQLAQHLWTRLLVWMLDAGMDEVVFAAMVVARDRYVVDDAAFLDAVRERRDLVDGYRFTLVSLGGGGGGGGTAEQCMDELIESLRQSADFEQVLLASRSILLLVFARRCAARVAALRVDWPRLCDLFLRVPAPASGHASGHATHQPDLALHRLLVAVVLADLVVARLPFRASRLAVMYTGGSVAAHTDLRTQIVVLRRVLNAFVRDVPRAPLASAENEPARVADRVLAYASSALGLETAILESVLTRGGGGGGGADGADGLDVSGHVATALAILDAEYP
ncbi:secretory pathway protein Sec39-domain-containing protein [Entophlyctis helioformis]|nr:secretory pathway protein Sec39-domain-containing protein [Entophlyctis helioformis]